MDAEEAARYLNVSPATLRRWVRQGLLRVGGANGRDFDRRDLDMWARRHGVPIGHRSSVSGVRSRHVLAEAIERGAVTAASDAVDSSRAIEAAVSAIEGLQGPSATRLLEEVLERERMATTAVGEGVALPHPRTPPGHLFDEPVVSVVQLAQPVDWAALDGLPVHTAFLLLSPSAPVHLKLLSRVANLVRRADFRGFLVERPSAAALVRRVGELEEDLSA